jgi:hypothetical protein
MVQTSSTVEGHPERLSREQTALIALLLGPTLLSPLGALLVDLSCPVSGHAVTDLLHAFINGSHVG